MHKVVSPRSRLLFLLGLTLAVVLATLLIPPIQQPPSYHDFAGQRGFFGLPNALDVASGLPFVVLGIYGLIALHVGRLRIVFVHPWERIPYTVMFLGVLLTGFGSAFYHLSPDNNTLAWDRLPMTMIFMAFITSVITERIGLKAGRYALIPLLLLGLSSVLYWAYSEQIGAGDLRFYGFIHFFPVLLIATMLWLYPPKYTRGSDVLIVFLLYGVATVFELLDKQVFSLGDIVSGHTIKHLLAAVAIYWLLRMLRKRQPAAR